MRVAPRTLRPNKLLLDATAASSQDCEGQTTRCSDCTTVLTCSRLGNIFRPVTTTTCPAATPYCLDGTCVADLPGDECNTPPEPTSKFVCNGDGYFPDPADCKMYYLCAGGNAYAYDCSAFANTRYSHARALCVPK